MPQPRFRKKNRRPTIESLEHRQMLTSVTFREGPVPAGEVGYVSAPFHDLVLTEANAGTAAGGASTLPLNNRANFREAGLIGVEGLFDEIDPSRGVTINAAELRLTDVGGSDEEDFSVYPVTTTWMDSGENGVNWYYSDYPTRKWANNNVRFNAVAPDVHSATVASGFQRSGSTLTVDVTHVLQKMFGNDLADGGLNQGFLISGDVSVYSSEATNWAYRPELWIDFEYDDQGPPESGGGGGGGGGPIHEVTFREGGGSGMENVVFHDTILNSRVRGHHRWLNILSRPNFTNAGLIGVEGFMDAIPNGSFIEEARLEFQMQSDSDGTPVRVYRVETNWMESGEHDVSGSNREHSTGTPWHSGAIQEDDLDTSTVATGIGAANGESVEIDVTQLVRDMFAESKNQGFLLDGNFPVHSSEADIITQRPRLTVRYSEPAANTYPNAEEAPVRGFHYVKSVTPYAEPRELVQLVASAFDDEYDVVDISWNQLTGSPVYIGPGRSGDVSYLTFTPGDEHVGETLSFQVIATNSQGNTIAEMVEVQVYEPANYAPQIDELRLSTVPARPVWTRAPGETLYLRGFASDVEDGNDLEYSWSVRKELRSVSAPVYFDIAPDWGGMLTSYPVNLANSDSDILSVAIPSVVETTVTHNGHSYDLYTDSDPIVYWAYSFTLNVTDSGGRSSSRTYRAFVDPSKNSTNLSPPDWFTSQSSGSGTDNDSNTAPNVQDISFEVLEDDSWVSIDGKSLVVGDLIRLSSDAFDADNDELEFFWTSSSGDDSYATRPVFVLDKAGSMRFTTIISDGQEIATHAQELSVTQQRIWGDWLVVGGRSGVPLYVSPDGTIYEEEDVPGEPQASARTTAIDGEVTCKVGTGDLDGNGVVDFGDFLVLSSNLGQRSGADGGDIDCNGVVTAADFERLSVNFGQVFQDTQTGNVADDGSETKQVVARRVTANRVTLLLPAVQAARAAARRQLNLNRLKRVTLAAVNFESVFGFFPGTGFRLPSSLVGWPVSRDRYSWRVALLPFLEERAFNDAFPRLIRGLEIGDRDEAALAEKILASWMPDVFKDANLLLKPGYTATHAVVGLDAATKPLFNDQNGDVRGFRRSHITDAPYPTMLFAMGNANSARLWYNNKQDNSEQASTLEDEPLRLVDDPENFVRPEALDVNTHGGVFLAGFAGGHVGTVPECTNLANLYGLMRRNDGGSISDGGDSGGLLDSVPAELAGCYPVVDIDTDSDNSGSVDSTIGEDKLENEGVGMSLTQGGAPGEVRLQAPPGGLPTNWKLQLQVAPGLDAWADSNKATRLTSDNTSGQNNNESTEIYEFTSWAADRSIYIESVEGDKIADVEWRLIDNRGNTVSSDVVKFSVRQQIAIFLDLGVEREDTKHPFAATTTEINEIAGRRESWIPTIEANEPQITINNPLSILDNDEIIAKFDEFVDRSHAKLTRLLSSVSSLPTSADKDAYLSNLATALWQYDDYLASLHTTFDQQTELFKLNGHDLNAPWIQEDVQRAEELPVIVEGLDFRPTAEQFATLQDDLGQAAAALQDLMDELDATEKAAYVSLGALAGVATAGVGMSVGAAVFTAAAGGNALAQIGVGAGLATINYSYLKNLHERAAENNGGVHFTIDALADTFGYTDLSISLFGEDPFNGDVVEQSDFERGFRGASSAISLVTTLAGASQVVVGAAENALNIGTVNFTANGGVAALEAVTADAVGVAHNGVVTVANAGTVAVGNGALADVLVYMTGKASDGSFKQGDHVFNKGLGKAFGNSADDVEDLGLWPELVALLRSSEGKLRTGAFTRTVEKQVGGPDQNSNSFGKSLTKFRQALNDFLEVAIDDLPAAKNSSQASEFLKSMESLMNSSLDDEAASLLGTETKKVVGEGKKTMLEILRLTHELFGA